MSNSKQKYNLKPSDFTTTPSWLSKKIIDSLPLSVGMSLLDCAKGSGSFYNNFPAFTTNHWSEISENKDFFDVTNFYDFIITSPPPSLIYEFLEHAMNITNDIVFLLPFSKIFSSQKRMELIDEFGGFVSIGYIGGSPAGFGFGFPIAVFHIKKNFKSSTKMYEIIK